jgi:hypothetical protein
MQPPTIALQRTRGAPRDRWHFERWVDADRLPDFAGAPLNSTVGRLIPITIERSAQAGHTMLTYTVSPEHPMKIGTK